MFPEASRVWCDRFEEVDLQLLQQMGFPAERLPAEFAPPHERLAAARRYLSYGHVSLSATARERLVSFRGARRNFLTEVLTLATVTERNPLALALATGVLIGLQGSVPALPTMQEDQGALTPTPPAPYVPSVLLSAGLHVIDGETVEVRGEPGEAVHHPIAPGRHVIDEILHIVPRSRGLRIL
jgi:hypothetical protein